jgi:hypothetical protein
MKFNVPIPLESVTHSSYAMVYEVLYERGLQAVRIIYMYFSYGMIQS